MTHCDPITIEQHAEFGRELNRMRGSLLRLMVDTARAYGKTSHAAKLADRTLQLADALRCEMEDRYFHEWPDEAIVGTYYPGPKREEVKP